MANEITIQASLKSQKNNISVSQITTSKVQTMESTQEKMHHTVQDVGTGAVEDLSSGEVDLTKRYMVLLYNLTSAKNVTVRVSKHGAPTDPDVGIMRPGEPWGPVRMPAQSGGYPKLLMISNTAASDVEVTVTEAGDPAA